MGLMGSCLPAIAVGLVLASADAGACTLKDLAWMAGTWRAETDGRRSEERWVAGPDDVLIGSAWAMAPGKPPFIEAETLTADGPAITLRLRHFSRNLAHAMEDVDAPMVFTLAGCEAGTAVFEGEGTRAGERMTYRRSGGTLAFVGDFIHDGKPVRDEITFSAAE